jgi:hypothetical protein
MKTLFISLFFAFALTSGFAKEKNNDQIKMNNGCTTMIVTLSCGAHYEDCIYGDYLGFLIGMLTWVDMNNTYCPTPKPSIPVYLA